jgi:hypothetical protein
MVGEPFGESRRKMELGIFLSAVIELDAAISILGKSVLL